MSLQEHSEHLEYICMSTNKIIVNVKPDVCKSYCYDQMVFFDGTIKSQVKELSH